VKAVKPVLPPFPHPPRVPPARRCPRQHATVRRCIAFARAHGNGGLDVANLDAYVATDPADLRRAGYRAGTLSRDTVLTSSPIRGESIRRRAGNC
jgi:hypothetical protein